MEENPKPRRRRWFRFSLRTMLVLVTLVCVYLGWAMNWKRQRREFFETGGGIALTSYRGLKDAPFAIRMFGEQGHELIQAKSERIEEARRLFPEAIIVDFNK